MPKYKKEIERMSGFDLETAIKTFLVAQEWDYCECLTAFLEFVKEQGMKIKEPQ